MEHNHEDQCVHQQKRCNCSNLWSAFPVEDGHILRMITNVVLLGSFACFNVLLLLKMREETMLSERTVIQICASFSAGQFSKGLDHISLHTK